MSGRLRNSLTAIVAGFLAAVCVNAQDGTYGGYTPYSVYGIGEIHNYGSAFNKSMGGVGIATRNRRFVNYMNPASLTARDSLSFMADFGLYGKTAIFNQNGERSINNIMNLEDFVISFPLFRHTAMMVGIAPYSDTGYNFTYIEQDPDRIGRTGTQGYSATGNGSIYQAFAGGAITLWDRLSLGAQYILYFGKIEKNVNLAFGKDSYRNIVSGHKLQLNASTAKFGLQYDQPLGGMTKMTIGGTYKLKAGMHGYTNDYSYATISSLTDTLKNNTVHLTGKENLKFSDELGVGISLKGGERWSAEVDYIRSDWRNLGYDETSGFSNSSAYVFSSSVAQSFRAGFEFTPNRSDIRYFYKRITYRGGLYYDQSYYRLDGNPIDSYGITLGATIPVNAGYNGITVGLEFGKKGTIKNGLVRENYFGFNIGFNIFDIWFQKSMYD